MDQSDHNKIIQLDAEMRAHEVQCEERWKTNFSRLEDIEAHLNRIENRIMIGAGSLIVFLSGVIVTLLTKGL